MKLYDYALSANCYKVRLMASLLGVGLDREAVDFYPGGAHKSPDFKALNPAGTLPVLVVDGRVLTDSAAILVWLAGHHDPGRTWYPAQDPARLADIQNWFAVADRLNATAGAARLHDMLRKPLDIETARTRARDTLRQIDSHMVKTRLRGGRFLLGDTPTLADIACFPHVALAPDGGISLDHFPTLRDWIFAIRTLPGFIEMPGIHPVHERIG